MRRRGTPELLVATLILVLIGWYVWYTHSVIVDLRADAQRSTAMYARVYHAIADTTHGALAALSLIPTVSPGSKNMRQAEIQSGAPVSCVIPRRIMSRTASP